MYRPPLAEVSLNILVYALMSNTFRLIGDIHKPTIPCQLRRLRTPLGSLRSTTTLGKRY